MAENQTKKTRILYLVTEDWYFVSHRLGLARAARDSGCDVVVVTRERNHRDVIEREGFKFVSFLLPRSKFSLLSELKSIVNLVRVYRQEKPDIVHHVALKPSLYGSLAAWIAGVPKVVNALTGLGFVFTEGHWKRRLMQPFVRIAGRYLLSRENSRVIIQNPDDLETLSRKGIIRKEGTVLIRGSGVGLDEFPKLAEKPGIMTIAMVSRMLWNKGVGELVEAARTLRAKGFEFRLLLIGMPDAENPTTIPERKICEWHDDGLVQWWGYRDDIVEIWREAQIAVLPSYREGLPKSLLEAAACGRPIVASDVPGCREITLDGENGILVPIQDSVALADALEKMITDPELRRRMGLRSRELVEERFHVDLIIDQTLEVYEELLNHPLNREPESDGPLLEAPA